MDEKVVNSHDAKAQLPRLIARVVTTDYVVDETLTLTKARIDALTTDRHFKATTPAPLTRGGEKPAAPTSTSGSL